MNKAGKLGGMGLAGAVLMAGAYLIIPHEGEVLGTYVDPAGIVTACYGRVDADFELGQTFTQDECLEQLAEDLDRFDGYLDLLVEVPLNPNRRAALLSFIYNIGPGAFRTSELRQKLNSGDYEGACNELSRWVHVDGRVLAGLVTRREAERELCLTRVKPEPKPAIPPPQLISLACHADHWRFYRPC